MKNKKADITVEEIAKLVIAVLIIAALVVLSYKLFNMFKKENQVKSARENLEIISQKIDYLKSADYTEDYLYAIIFPPKGWYLRNYLIEDKGTPEGECVGRYVSCLCLCKDSDCSGLKGCRGLNFEIEIFHFEEGVMMHTFTETGETCRFLFTKSGRWDPTTSGPPCLDLSGKSYSEGVEALLEEYGKIIYEPGSYDVIKFSGKPPYEIKISKQEELIKIELSDR